MPQITLNGVSFSYKKYFESIFENVNLNINTDWKLGLIGRNGRGKTTLLKLIFGELVPDKGNLYKNIDTEYFPYENTCNYTKTLDVIKENIGGLRSLEDNLEDMDCLQTYLDLDGYEMESRIKKEMNHMRLPESLLEQEFESLSGGEKTKILMIALFLRKNAFILLDEPTNHLDLSGRQTIANYLSKKKGFIIISHDIEFLDKVIDHVLSINKVGISLEKGNYSTWKKNKDQKELFESRTKERLERDIVSLEKRAETTRNWAALAEKEKNPFATHARGNGSRAFMRQAKNSENLVKEHLENKKSLLHNYEIAKTLELHQEKLETECLVKVNNLTFGYSERILIKDLSLKIFTGDSIWIKGENGAGKSTLLKLLSQRIQNQWISYEEGLIIAEAYQEPLWKNGFLHNLFPLTYGHDREAFDKFKELNLIFDMPEDFLDRPLGTYSSGELKKVDIARALAIKNNLLFLDEPLNYMDVYFREQLEKAILLYKPTMVFVEHDIRFGNNIANKVIELS